MCHCLEQAVRAGSRPHCLRSSGTRPSYPERDSPTTHQRGSLGEACPFGQGQSACRPRDFGPKCRPCRIPKDHADPSPLPEPRYQPLVIVLTAAVAGILADRFWPLPLAAWWTLAAAGLVLWIVVFDLASRRLLRPRQCPVALGGGGNGGGVAPLLLESVRRRRLGLLCQPQGPAGLHRGRGGRIAEGVASANARSDARDADERRLAAGRRSGFAAQRRDVAAGLRPGNAAGDGRAAERRGRRPHSMLRPTLGARGTAESRGVRLCRPPPRRSGAQPCSRPR